jgi:hypothetical protein
MKSNEQIRRAIYNMGGPKAASKILRSSVSTIGKWIRNGVIPNIDKARMVAEGSGYELHTLRPWREPYVIV